MAPIMIQVTNCVDGSAITVGASSLKPIKFTLIQLETSLSNGKTWSQFILRTDSFHFRVIDMQLDPSKTWEDYLVIGHAYIHGPIEVLLSFSGPTASVGAGVGGGGGYSYSQSSWTAPVPVKAVFQHTISSSDTLLAIDDSGSTGNSSMYHSTIKEFVLDKVPHGKVVAWNSELLEMSMAKYSEERNAKQYGQGGTNPARVKEYCMNKNFHGILYLVSDGQVQPSDIDATEFPSDWRFEKVIVVLIYTGGMVNQSVSAPFVRNSPHEIYLFQRAGLPPTITSNAEEVMNVDQNIALVNSLATFDLFKEVIKKGVIARTMGTQASKHAALKDRLIAMKARIAQDLEKQASAKVAALIEITVPELASNLIETKDVGPVLAHLVKLHKAHWQDDEEVVETGTWSTECDRLVAMANGALRNAFDPSQISFALQTAVPVYVPAANGRLARAKTATADVPESEPESEAKMECAVLLDPATPVLRIVRDAVFPFASLEKAKMDNVLNDPLYLMKDEFKDDLQALLGNLDRPLGFEASAQVEKGPETRAELRGDKAGIYFGTSSEAILATNTALSILFFGGKTATNMDMVFAVLYFAIKRGDYERMEATIPAFEEQMRARLCNRYAPMSMGGNAEFPRSRVPLVFALLYLVHCGSTIDHAKTLRHLRLFTGSMHWIRKLLELYELVVSEDIWSYWKNVGIMLSMLNEIKKNPDFANRVMALHQNAYFLERSQVHEKVLSTERWFQFIPLDGPATPEQREIVKPFLDPRYRDEAPGLLLAIARLVDKQSTASQVNVPFVIPLLGDADAMDTYSIIYGLDPERETIDEVKVSAGTMRPFYRAEVKKNYNNKPNFDILLYRMATFGGIRH
jgi:hypothetical protein